MADLDPDAIIQLLQNPEQYKKNAKPYKNQISKSDMNTMQVMTQVIQECLQRQKEVIPMILLNAIRFIKETLDRNSPKREYQELIAERILPEMVITAQFQKENKQEDRGKFYFSDQPSNELAILGNSFFRLVLECLLVWSGWFPNSVYSDYFNQLVEIGVSFPDQLNYFKEENEKRTSQISQGQFQSSQRQSNAKSPSLTQIQGQNQSSTNINNNNQVKSCLSDINLNSIQRSGEFSKILVQILIQFKKIKEGVRTNLLNDQLDLDQFNHSVAEIRQYSNDFKVLIEKSNLIENSPSFESHLSSLYQESQFADTFIVDIQKYKQKSISFDDIRRNYTTNIKPLRTQSSMSPSNQQYEQEQQNFNDYNQNNGYNNQLKNGDKIIEQNNQRFGGYQQNQYNREYGDEEEKYNNQNTFGSRKSEETSYSTPTPAPNEISGRGNNHQSQYNQQVKFGSDQFNSQQGSELGDSQRLLKRSSFKHLLEQNDVDKYKLQMRSGSNYRKMSPSPSNQSSYYSSSLKSAIIKKPGSQNSKIDSQITVQRGSEEIQQLKIQIEQMENEKNMWKQKYEEAALELQNIRQNQHQ